MAGRLGANFQCMQMSEWLLKSLFIHRSLHAFSTLDAKGNDDIFTINELLQVSAGFLSLFPVLMAVGMMARGLPQEIHDKNLCNCGEFLKLCRVLCAHCSRA